MFSKELGRVESRESTEYKESFKYYFLRVRLNQIRTLHSDFILSDKCLKMLKYPIRQMFVHVCLSASMSAFTCYHYRKLMNMEAKRSVYLH